MYKNVISKMSSSRLISAVSNGDEKEVKKALLDGVDPNTKMPFNMFGLNKNRVPVLTAAVTMGYTGVVKQILEAKADTEHKGDYGCTALIPAIKHGNLPIVEQLLKHGANVNASNGGWLPIHYAALGGHIKIAKLLKARGTNIDVATTYGGDTPLLLAAYTGKKDMAEWLLVNGANSTAVDDLGRGAVILAERRGCTKLADWLRSYKHPLNIADNISVTDSMELLRIKVTKAPTEKNQPQKKKVFVINYIKFSDKNNKFLLKTENINVEREGADEDSKNLRSTFEKLGYEVHIHENMTAEQTNALLDTIQHDETLKFLVLFILSHGVDRDTFFASDGTQLSLENIQYRFTNKNCPQLKGLLKVIFSNFCRGQSIEKIVSDSMPPRDETPHNMITIHASHEGFKARRSTIRGTLFIHNLCEVIKKQPNLTIQQIFNEIFNKMENDEDEGQTPKMEVSAPFIDFRF